MIRLKILAIKFKYKNKNSLEIVNNMLSMLHGHGKENLLI